MKILRSRYYLTAALIGLLSIGTAYVGQAQETTARPPSLAFDLYGKQLAESKLVKSIPIPPAPNGGNVLAAKRLYGVFSLPSSMADVLQMQPDSPPPIDLLLVGEFDNKQDREQLISDAMLQDSQTTEFNGKTYRMSPESEELLMYADDQRIEGGSRGYLALPRQSMLSPQLKAAMAELGSAPVRVALDLTEGREVVQEAIDILKQQGVPPLVIPFLDLPKKMDQLMLAVDPDGADLVRLLVKSGNAEDAGFVKKSLDGLVGLSQMGLAQAPKGDPSIELIAALLKGTKVTQKENRVSLVITKPSGFDDMLAKSVAAAQQAAQMMQRQNNVRQMLLSMHNYESACRVLPFNHEVEDRLSGQLSWRVKVLPFIELDLLYRKFKMNEPWDSDSNKPLADQCPELMGAGQLSNICWIQSEANGFRDITDGTSNTICMIEVSPGVPWTQPVDLTIEQAEKLILGQPEGQSLIIGMYDGSVRTIDRTINPQTLRALLTINGGEVIDDF